MLNANWLAGIVDAYDRSVQLGYVGQCDGSLNTRPLAPPHHSVVTADIEVYVSTSSSFMGGEILYSGEDDVGVKTVAPCSYAARAAKINRATTPYALTERILYILDSDLNGGHSKYLENAEAFMSAPEFSEAEEEVQTMLRAVYSYIGTGTLLQDLQDCPETKLALMAVQDGEGSYNPYIRFTVVMPDGVLLPLYQDWRIWDLFSQYLDASEHSDAERPTICYATGAIDLQAQALPNNILRRYAQAGIIGMKGSRGRGTGRYTVVGPQFSSRSEAFAIGQTAADKLVSMLRWLSDRQYYTLGNLYLMVWAKDDPGERLYPSYIFAPGPVSKEREHTPLQYALMTANRAIGQPFEGEDRTCCLLLLGVPSKGRISVLNYQEVPGGKLVQNIRMWYQQLRFSEGGPCPLKTVLESVEAGPVFDSGGALKNTYWPVAMQLMDNIVNGTPLSRRIVDMASLSLIRTTRWGNSDGRAIGINHTWSAQLQIVYMLWQKYLVDHPEAEISTRDKLYAQAYNLLQRIEWIARKVSGIDNTKSLCWMELEAFFTAPDRTISRLGTRLRPLLAGKREGMSLYEKLESVKRKISDFAMWDARPLDTGVIYCICEAGIKNKIENNQTEGQK